MKNQLNGDEDAWEDEEWGFYEDLSFKDGFEDESDTFDEDMTQTNFKSIDVAFENVSKLALSEAEVFFDSAGKEISKDEFKKQLQLLYRQGGRNKDAVDEWHKILGLWTQDPSKDPIAQILQRTKTKEKRLNDCEKFSILERYRLITQRVADSRMMRFIGNHDASENWLNRSSKEVITVNKNGALNTVSITDKFDKENRNNEFDTDYHEHHLLDRIKNQDDYAFILQDVPPGSAIKLSRLDTTSVDDEFLDAIKEINDDNKQSFLIDILDTLRKGDLEGLTKRIKAEKGEIKPLEDFSSLIHLYLFS